MYRNLWFNALHLTKEFRKSDSVSHGFNHEYNLLVYFSFGKHQYSKVRDFKVKRAQYFTVVVKIYLTLQHYTLAKS